MYEVERYTSTNDVGTAVLFEQLIDQPVRRVVTASSMSIYGEGLYHDADGATVEDAERRGLRDGLSNWEPVDAQGRPLTPVATPEWKRPNLASIYALNKYVQERTTHIMAAPYGMEGVCLRLFNVYGPGQALSNPYTGVLAIFASRLLNGQQPMIFEDGEQRRDFVHVTRCGARLRRCAGAAAGGGRHVQHRLGPGPLRHRGRDRAGAGDGQEQHRARDRRQGADRRYPPLLLRHLSRRRQARVRSTAGFRRRVGRARGVGRAADRARPRGADAGRARSAGAGRMSGGAGDDPRPILITGGAGFIGSNLADRLAADGHRRHRLRCAHARRACRAISTGWSHAHGDRIEPVVADIRDEALLADAAVRAKAVFHMAAQVAVTTSLVDPREDFAINMAGTLGLLEALRTRAPKTPLIFASTNKVYGDLADIGLRLEKDAYRPTDFQVRAHGIGEARPLDFHTPYGCSKGAADQYVLDYARSFGLRTAVLRMSCIYGQRQMGTEDQGWVAHFLIRALEGQPITLYGDGCQVRDILDVSDAVSSLSRRLGADRRCGRAGHSI